MSSKEIKKYQQLLFYYFQKNHPEKLMLNPRVFEVTKTHVKLGIHKYFGILLISRIILESNLKKSKV